MTTSDKRLHMIAIKMLEHVGDDIRDIDYEIMTLSKEIETFVARSEDAKWAGDSEKVNGLSYQIRLKQMMQAVLQKRRKAKLKEMVG